MTLNLRFLKITFLICSLLVLIQCTKVTTENYLQVNKQLASPYTMPAAAYLALAKNQSGVERSSLLLMAAGRLIYDGQWQQGQSILNQIHDLSGQLLDEKRLLLAKIELIRGQPRSAIAQLATVQDLQHLAIYYQVQFHEMLAGAYQMTHQGANAVMERIKLDHLLPDEASKANNRRAIWLSLTTLPRAELDTLAIEVTDDALLMGWVKLALISRQSYADPQNMLQAVEQWQAQYPHHPAENILSLSQSNPKLRLLAKPKQMALLLPLSGPLAGPGSAIKDGFMAAHDATETAADVTVRVYNTANSNVVALYQQAVANGADYVVGPLSKTDVAAVAAVAHPVPTILLNDLATHIQANAYLFGLSPSSEARQVATKARKNGRTRALVIAPAGAWGSDVVNAFASQWRANGGQIVDTLYYNEREDLNAAVRDFLRVSDSESREKQLKRLLGSNLEATPQRRQDFDMIFLLAYPSKARQIMPLLKYYYAGDIPVYATSSVYAGDINTMKDRDLDGIIFCDMPWVFSHQAGNRNWPEQLNSYNRLYALGMDSYALSQQLNQLLLFPALGVSDKSGVLYLSSPQQIARILVFGQFRQGVAQMNTE